MIRYALACLDGHRFESWFRGSADYDQQVTRGLITCPVCHSATVAKTIMAPAIVGRGAESSGSVVVDMPALPAVRPLLDQRQVDLRGALKAIREKILREGEDVGTRFPKEARKMHDGDIPHRHIHGQATFEEARALVEDGVAILPVPPPPDALN